MRMRRHLFDNPTEDTELRFDWSALGALVRQAADACLQATLDPSASIQALGDVASQEAAST